MTPRAQAPEPPASGLTIWSHLRPYRRALIYGVAMLLATNVLFLGIPVLTGKIIKALDGTDPGGEVPLLVIGIAAFALGTAVTRIWSRTAIFNTARDAEYDLRSRLFGHLMRFEPAFYRKNPTGDVMSRLTNDVATVRAMWGAGILNIANTCFAFATVLIMMVRIDPVLTLWTMLPYPVILLTGRVLGRRIYRTSMGVQEQLGKLSTALQEDLTGIGVIKTYGIEDERRRKFREASEVLLARNMALTHTRGQLVPVLSTMGSLGTVILLWVGGTAVIAKHLELGHMIEFHGYLARLVWPTLALGWMLSLFQRGNASWKRLETLLRAEPSIRDGAGDGAPPLEPEAIRGDLELRHLTIAIDGRTLLDDISLTMKAGTVTAIVGRTGAGKSTLVAALPRLLDVPVGAVFLDGRDITTLPLATLRGAIGYAPQEAFLFSTTIAENIAFGVSDPSIAADHRKLVGLGLGADAVPHPRIREAAAAAGLERDLAAMPEGYQTVVGERGITLSGGQRQRVALARALARQPRVLVLDDSLSSVDAETERVILGHLGRLMAGRTAILISHRVAAVKRADQIVVLDEGRIVERGTHDELLSRRGLYAEVYESQLDEEIVGAIVPAPPQPPALADETAIPPNEADTPALEAGVSSGETDIP